MIKKATAMTVRQYLGELLNGIQYGNDQVVITKRGKPVAAMVDNALFDKIRLLKRVFNRLTGALRDSPACAVRCTKALSWPSRRNTAIG